MNVFVERIDELLKKKNLSRNDLNSAIGLPKNIIAQWKIRETIPAADVAVKIAQYLDTSVEYLVNGTEKDAYKEKYDNLKEAVQTALEEN